MEGANNPIENQKQYHDADADIEVTQEFYFSRVDGRGIFLGKTWRKSWPDGKVTYTLFDPSGHVLGPDVPDDETAQDVWGKIIDSIDRRDEELKKTRDAKDNKDHDKGRGK